MLKAKALCVVDGSTAPEMKPLLSEAGEEKKKPPLQKKKLKDLVGNMQNIVIESIGDDEEVPEEVVELAIKLMENDSLIKDFLLELRQHYIRGQREFNLSLNGRSEAEKKKILSLFQEMAGVVSAVRYCGGYQTLNGYLNMTPKAQSFLTGKYLELAVYDSIRNLLAKLAEQYHVEYEVYRNVRVASKDGILKNEFDIVVLFNGIFYVVECKSGKNFNDWGSFCEVGATYGVVPGRLLMVDSYVTDKLAKRIEYFCEYYVCNLTDSSLQDKVTKMITNDLAA